MNAKALRRKKIHLGLRKKIQGTATKPRLSVYRSNKKIYAQAIDDLAGVTIASTSSDGITGDSNIAIAKAAGKALGEKLTAININTAVFDRSGYLYHGRVKALADGVREAGVKI